LPGNTLFAVIDNQEAVKAIFDHQALNAFFTGLTFQSGLT
jgi:hypothetical protein